MINLLINNKANSILRILLILLNDFFLINVSLYFSYYIRIEYFISIFDVKEVFAISTALYLLNFFIFNINKQYFRHFNLNTLQLYFKIFIFFVFTFTIYVLFQERNFIPRSLIFIFPICFFFLIIINRILVAKFFQNKLSINKKKIIVFGFNHSFITSLLSNYTIIHFIDDKKYQQKRIINNIEIISTKNFLKNYKNFKYDLILIENEKIFNRSKDIIRNFIIDNNILVQKIFLKNGNISTSSYFDFNYFFNRKNKITPLLNVYNKKTILITGAGGSIGSNIVFQLLNTNYKTLILLDNSEYNLYVLSNLIKDQSNIEIFLMNFNEFKRVSNIFNKFKVDIIFHSAAYKHVPIIEFNPFAAIKNNFLDTFEFMNLSIKYKVNYFCLISSDKAVRPTNIMGSSKRLAELALQYYSNFNNHSTIFCAVRFGNVINSSGSVMPLFKKQIDQNQIVTLTHKNIVRYFMTIEEASNLVLNTYKISQGGEIFLLDMGEPIKLFDLAKLMIQFSGKTVKVRGKGEIEIKLIGLRKGEKLYEELLVDKKSIPSKVNSIYQSIEAKIDSKSFKKLYIQIYQSYKEDNVKNLITYLNNDHIRYKPENV